MEVPKVKVSKEYEEFISGNYRYISNQDLQTRYQLILRQIDIDANLNVFDKFEARNILRSAKESYIWGMEL